MESKIDIKVILLIAMCVSLGVILSVGYIISSELYSAKKECEKIDGTYQLKSFGHLCNNETFYKYSDGTWDFDKTLSWNDTTINYPLE